MPITEFLPLSPKTFNVKSFDCGKESINTYLRRYAAKNMALMAALFDAAAEGLDGKTLCSN